MLVNYAKKFMPDVSSKIQQLWNANIKEILDRDIN